MHATPACRCSGFQLSDLIRFLFVRGNSLFSLARGFAHRRCNLWDAEARGRAVADARPLTGNVNHLGPTGLSALPLPGWLEHSYGDAGKGADHPKSDDDVSNADDPNETTREPEDSSVGQ